MKSFLFKALFLSFVMLTSPAIADFGKVLKICDLAFEGKEIIADAKRTANRNHIKKEKSQVTEFETGTFQDTVKLVISQRKRFDKLFDKASLFFENESNQSNPTIIAQYLADVLVFASRAKQKATPPVSASINLNISNLWRTQLLDIWTQVINICNRESQNAEFVLTPEVQAKKDKVQTAIAEIKSKDQKAARKQRPMSMSVKNYEEVLIGNTSPRKLGSSTATGGKGLAERFSRISRKTPREGQALNGSDQAVKRPVTVIIPDIPPISPRDNHPPTKEDQIAARSATVAILPNTRVQPIAPPRRDFNDGLPPLTTYLAGNHSLSSRSSEGEMKKQVSKNPPDIPLRTDLIQNNGIHLDQHPQSARRVNSSQTREASELQIDNENIPHSALTGNEVQAAEAA